MSSAIKILKKIFKKRNAEVPVEHAVIVRFNYGILSLDPLHNLEKELDRIIEEYKVGEYDGHEIAIDYSHGILYMYGPNAELLFKTIHSKLSATEFMQGAVATLRFGPPVKDVREIDISI